MKRTILLALFIVLLPTLSIAQTDQLAKTKRWYNPFQVNAFDKDKEYHGLWKVYLDDDKQKLIRKGRFKHGKEVGTWRYYYPSGGLYMKEKYKPNSPVIQVWRYHENGKLAKSGMAKLYRTDTMAHYYWEGDWQVFDEQGNLSHTETYLKGNLIGKR